MEDQKEISRRYFLLSSAAGVMAGIAVDTTTAAARAKVSKAVARYDRPRGAERCGGCKNFRGPDGCVRVDGRISPDGWCRLYSAKAPGKGAAPSKGAPTGGKGY
jgi:hypothetical protein